MNQTLRQLLKDLISDFNDTAQNATNGIRFKLVEDLIEGSVEISSSVSPFTLVLAGDITQLDEGVKDISAFVVDNAEGEIDALEAMLDGNPQIRLPLTTIKVSDAQTHYHLYMALLTTHAFKATKHLLAFEKQTKAE